MDTIAYIDRSRELIAPLPSFDEARPLGSDDELFVAELHELLVRHNNLNRFGLCLLHDHFPVADGEVLLETNDKEKRMLSLEVAQLSALRGQDIKETSWRLTGLAGNRTRPQAAPLTACAQDKCKIEPAGALAGAAPLTACAQDKCKIEPAGALAGAAPLTACAQDKCKIEAPGLR